MILKLRKINIVPISSLTTIPGPKGERRSRPRHRKKSSPSIRRPTVGSWPSPSSLPAPRSAGPSLLAPVEKEAAAALSLWPEIESRDGNTAGRGEAEGCRQRPDVRVPLLLPSLRPPRRGWGSREQEDRTRQRDGPLPPTRPRCRIKNTD